MWLVHIKTIYIVLSRKGKPLYKAVFVVLRKMFQDVIYNEVGKRLFLITCPHKLSEINHINHKLYMPKYRRFPKIDFNVFDFLCIMWMNLNSINLFRARITRLINTSNTDIDLLFCHNLERQLLLQRLW